MKLGIIAGLLAGLGVATAALAEDALTTADQCVKAAFDLGQAAEEKSLSDDQYKKVQGMITTMEGQCDAQQFAEASASAKDIKAMLAGLP